MARRILDQPVFLVRGGDGKVMALDDRCAHRFAPLSQGKMIGDAIECPYHGLRYGRDGACVLNPHGEGVIPEKLRVRSYPVVERYQAVWLWTGDPALADDKNIPDFSPLDDSAHYTFGFDYMNVNANYELISDNLLDLSHSEYLHPDFNQPGANKHALYKCFQEGNTVHSNRLHPKQEITRIMRQLWTSSSEVGDRRANLRWDPPALMFLDVGVTEVDAPEGEKGVCLPSVHFLTPETGTSTHYFTAIGRNVKLAESEITERLRKMNIKALHTEDCPMIEAQQNYLFGNAFRELRPVLLSFDLAAIRARRVMDGLFQAEASPK
jgi:vanillate O-demethylase monooxygenase subunit